MNYNPKFVPGDRIEMVEMCNDPHPILPGTKGTVVAVFINPWDQVQLNVDWDNGRTLGVILPDDKVIKI